VQPPLTKIERPDWEKAMREAATNLFGMAWKDFPLNEPSHKDAEELARQKYSQMSYNGRR
jgi:hypothetical protein